jgi:hypothetical protein
MTDLGDEIKKDEEQKVKTRIGLTQFDNDLQQLIVRHSLENDLTYAETIGMLMLTAFDQCCAASGIISFDDFDEEEDLC